MGLKPVNAPKKPPDGSPSHVELLARVKSLEQQLSAKDTQSAQQRLAYVAEIDKLTARCTHGDLQLSSAHANYAQMEAQCEKEHAQVIKVGLEMIFMK